VKACVAARRLPSTEPHDRADDDQRREHGQRRTSRPLDRVPGQRPEQVAEDEMARMEHDRADEERRQRAPGGQPAAPRNADVEAEPVDQGAAGFPGEHETRSTRPGNGTSRTAGRGAHPVVRVQ
jgi:hypothetical protein